MKNPNLAVAANGLRQFVGGEESVLLVVSGDDRHIVLARRHADRNVVEKDELDAGCGGLLVGFRRRLGIDRNREYDVGLARGHLFKIADLLADIVGSRHPVSLRQIEVAAAARPEWFAPLAESGFEPGAQTTLEARGRCIVLPDLAPGLSETEAIKRIAGGVERLAGRLPPPAALTVVGGETFAAACRVLKATWLSVDGEFLPGIPASRTESGLWRGTVCASKSGAFGEPDWLLNHLA